MGEEADLSHDHLILQGAKRAFVWDQIVRCLQLLDVIGATGTGISVTGIECRGWINTAKDDLLKARDCLERQGQDERKIQEHKHGDG